jgi:hypothetical protein
MNMYSNDVEKLKEEYERLRHLYKKLRKGKKQRAILKQISAIVNKLRVLGLVRSISNEKLRRA